MRKMVLIAVACVALAGCDSHSDAKEAVKRQLTDPQSAMFDDVATTKGVTCGFVNSKNRMGGYSGWHVFIYDGGIISLHRRSKTAGESQKVFDLCNTEQGDRYLLTILN